MGDGHRRLKFKGFQEIPLGFRILFTLTGPYFPALHFACEEGPQAMVAGRGR
jgi:hypothetical protein